MTTFVDIDLSFKKHPNTKDVLKKIDVEAAKQAIKNLFFTNPFEKPFNPYYGIGINSFLFENKSPITSIILKRKVQEQLNQYERRIVIDQLDIVDVADSNSIEIELKFYVIGNNVPQKLNIVLERTR